MRLAATLAVLSCAMGVAGAATLLEAPLAPTLRDAPVLPLDAPDAPTILLAAAADAPHLLPAVPLLPDDLVLLDLAATDAPADAALLLREAPPPPAPRPARAPAAPKVDRLDAAPTPEPAATLPAHPPRAFAPPPASAAAARAYAPPLETADAPPPPALAGALAGILTLLGFSLYHRIRPNAALENETRKTIFDTVCARPGLGVHAIAEAAGVSYSTATYHLERLVAAGMLVMTPDGNKLRYYKNGGAFTETERRILPLLKNAEASRLLDAILAAPGTYRAELAERLGVTATTVNWHLKRLRDAGLVRETRQGRNAYLHVDVPAMRAAMLPLAQKLGASDPAVMERIRHYAATTGSASS